MSHPLRPVGLASLIMLFAVSAAAAFAGSSPEEVRQFEQTKVRADAGESWSQYSLGNHYEMGSGVKKDLAQAIRWYRKSAEQGDVDGQSALANLYFEGPMEVRDLAQGVHWLRKAAEQGGSGSQRLLGLAYEQGLGVEKDPIESAKWFEKSAKQGDVIAQRMLGLHHLLAAEGPGRLTRAYAYLFLAALNDDAFSKTLCQTLESRMSPEALAEARRRTLELRKEIDANLAARKGAK